LTRHRKRGICHSPQVPPSLGGARPRLHLGGGNGASAKHAMCGAMEPVTPRRRHPPHDACLRRDRCATERRIRQTTRRRAQGVNPSIRNPQRITWGVPPRSGVSPKMGAGASQCIPDGRTTGRSQAAPPRPVEVESPHLPEQAATGGSDHTVVVGLSGVGLPRRPPRHPHGLQVTIPEQPRHRRRDPHVNGECAEYDYGVRRPMAPSDWRSSPPSRRIGREWDHGRYQPHSPTSFRGR
jgi:hypothetical protein